MCNGKRKRPATDEDADIVAGNGSASIGANAVTFFTAGLQPPMGNRSDMLAPGRTPSEPVVVYTGPTKTGAALIAAVAADAGSRRRQRGKKAKIARRRHRRRGTQG